MSERQKLRIGFIPLADAAALLVAVDRGFAREEGIEVELIREVSWSNVRDKLNIGMFDAAHLLAPVAIASNLGIGHVRVPIIAPFNLGLNGNAITVTNALQKALQDKAEGDLADPKVSAKALAAIVAERKGKGLPLLKFGMTFPFSTHNYQLRFWMASGGVDPDEDVQMVVLPPPFMVESIKNGHVDAFCVGAPWNSVAVDLGVAHILHFVSEILQRAAEKMLAMRTAWANENPEVVYALVRAHKKAADFIENEANRDEVCKILSAPDRLNVAPEITRRTLDGRLKVSPNGVYRESDRYLMVGRRGAARPDRAQASWLYAQMVRWGQAPLSKELLLAARETFRPDIYDRVLGAGDLPPEGEPKDGVGAFDGPEFDALDLEKHLTPWQIRRG
jgi:ABC-type nitrate/sulfonate/bicarbonate transport system substrate-binding protein